jgi:hypothetical protein
MFFNFLSKKGCKKTLLLGGSALKQFSFVENCKMGVGGIFFIQILYVVIKRLNDKSKLKIYPGTVRKVCGGGGGWWVGGCVGGRWLKVILVFYFGPNLFIQI